MSWRSARDRRWTLTPRQCRPRRRVQAASRLPVVTTPAAKADRRSSSARVSPLGSRPGMRSSTVIGDGQASIRGPSRSELQSVAFCSGRVRPYGRVVRRVAYLFVIGSGRCGSTLVHRVLAGHPDVGWISSADDRLRGFGPKGRLNRRLWLAPGATMPDFVRDRYQPSEAYRLLADRVSPILIDALPRPDRGGRLAVAQRAVRPVLRGARRGAGHAGVPAQVHGLAAGRPRPRGAPRGAVPARRA